MRVVWQPETRQVQVSERATADPGFGHEVLDSTALTEVLWAEYSTAVTARFQHTFPETIWPATKLPREVVELHLLVDLYRPHAFPALLAERLARAIVAQINRQTPASQPPRECTVRLSPLAGAPEQIITALKHELQRQLQQPTTSHPKGAQTSDKSFGANLKSWLGAIIGITATSLKLLHLFARRTRCISNRIVLPEHLFVLFSGTGNHTRQLWKWLETSAAPRHNSAILVLGQQALEPELIRRATALHIRVFHFWRMADLPGAIRKLLASWGTLSRLTARAANDLHLQCGIGFQARAAAWWLRGWLHEAAARRLRFANPGNTLAHFGLVAHADSRLADLVLRRNGLKTIHWLHGIVEDSLHYRAHSTACLCQNPVDADLRSAYGSYIRCLTPALNLEAIPRHPNLDRATASGVLVITNLLHPDNRFANAGAAEALDQLLKMVAAYFSRTRVSLLTWRPHPRETATVRFPEFQKIATELGFKIDNRTPLAEQVRRHRHVIATFSGSIGAVAAAGAVPAVFAGLPYETQGHWGRLPAEIKFRTAAELDAVLNQPRSETSLIRLRDQLCAQYHQPALGAGAIHRALEELRASSSSQPANPAQTCPEIASC